MRELPDCKPKVGLHAFMVGGSETVGSGDKWHCRLAIAADLFLRDCTSVPVSALVDTGSEVNLIRKGLLDPSQTRACGPEVRFCAVNKQSLGKEHRQVSCEIAICGVTQDTCVAREVVCPVKAFDAPIDVDMILSYEWLARQNAQVYPRRHGVAFEAEGYSVWVPGIPVGAPARARGAKVCRVRRGRRSPVSEAPDPDDYGMRDEVFAECTRRLGLQPTRDCFATKNTAKCEKFFGPEQDGLAQEWDPREVLWVNPPGPCGPVPPTRCWNRDAPVCASSPLGVRRGCNACCMPRQSDSTLKLDRGYSSGMGKSFQEPGGEPG